MSFQICLKTDKSLQQLATEIRELFSLPPFAEHAFAGAPYCQFDMLGMLIMIHWAEEDERDPEVIDYPYCFELQFSFTDHQLDTDPTEYALQPYYAQLLAFRLNIETACHEKQRVGRHWQVRYRYYCKNPKWRESVLFGEKGWEPAVSTPSPSPWRNLNPMI